MRYLLIIVISVIFASCIGEITYKPLDIPQDTLKADTILLTDK